ncbi:hypothetical protein ACQKMN_14440 [Ureibacillus composti]
MARCPKCGNTEFSMEYIHDPIEMTIINCSDCDTFISRLESDNLSKWKITSLNNDFSQRRELQLIASNLEKVIKHNNELIDLLNKFKSYQ